MALTAEIGIIGGTGVYDPAIFGDFKKEKVYTPFGHTSDLVTVGDFKGINVAFIPRHVRDHIYPPHKVPYKANIYAMKQLGVSTIIAPMAVGSLREEMAPGDLALPDQFIDNTRTRDYTYFDGGKIAHINMAEPFCPITRSLLKSAAAKLGISCHTKGTYVCIEGPRFSTKAESNMYRQWGADLIGMTLIPEAILAREAEICYQPICMITDYDVWKEGHSVTVEDVTRIMSQNVSKTREMLTEVIPHVAGSAELKECKCRQALKDALL